MNKPTAILQATMSFRKCFVGQQCFIMRWSQQNLHGYLGFITIDLVGNLLLSEKNNRIFGL